MNLPGPKTYFPSAEIDLGRPKMNLPGPKIYLPPAKINLGRPKMNLRRLRRRRGAQ